MKHICKLCGKEFSSGYYIYKESSPTCGLCSEYCMKKCKIASNTTTSWHSEPCISCTNNPYRIKHKWNGKEWVKND